MLAGHSTSQGIVLYDTSKQDRNGILCYLKNDQYRYKRGNYKELIVLNNTLDKPFTNPRPWSILIIIFLEVVFFTALIWLTSVLAKTTNAVAASIVFAVISFFPLLSIAYSTQRHYQTTSDHARFKRHHAAEHMILRYVQHNKTNLTMDKLRKTSRLHQECGTVYMGTLILFAGILSICIGIAPQIGAANAVAYVLLGAVALFLNIVNPLNPLKLLQLPVTEKPTETELNTVFQGMLYLLNETTPVRAP